jgi:hypothetical protein
MTCRVCSLVAVLFVAVNLQASASFPFGKKTKTDPVKRLPELVVQVQTDQDERKRANAAEELRHFDPQQFPDLVPLLIEVLKNDAKPTVRLEALQSLSKIRPTTQEARQAMDKAAASDTSLRVRLQARTSLMFYSVSAPAPKKNEQGPVLTPVRPNDPPVVANPKKGPAPMIRTPAPALKSAPRSTKEPPLAQPAQPSNRPPQLVPTNPPQLETPPPTQGPDLFPKQ